MKRYPLLCVLLLSRVAFSQDDVKSLTSTSTEDQNLIEFMNPPEGGYGRTRVIGRSDRFAINEIDIDFGQPLFVVDVMGVQGQRSFVVQSGLPNGATRFYSVFVFDGERNAIMALNVEDGKEVFWFVDPTGKDTVYRIHDDGSRVVCDWAVTVPGASIPTYPPGPEFPWVGSSDGGLYPLEPKTGAQTVETLTSGIAGVGSPSFDVVVIKDGEVIAVEIPFSSR